MAFAYKKRTYAQVDKQKKRKKRTKKGLDYGLQHGARVSGNLHDRAVLYFHVVHSQEGGNARFPAEVDEGGVEEGWTKEGNAGRVERGHLCPVRGPANRVRDDQVFINHSSAVEVEGQVNSRVPVVPASDGEGRRELALVTAIANVGRVDADQRTEVSNCIGSAVETEIVIVGRCGGEVRERDRSAILLEQYPNVAVWGRVEVEDVRTIDIELDPAARVWAPVVHVGHVVRGGGGQGEIGGGALSLNNLGYHGRVELVLGHARPSGHVCRPVSRAGRVVNGKRVRIRRGARDAVFAIQAVPSRGRCYNGWGSGSPPVVEETRVED